MNYEYLDSGDEQRLEKFGEYTLVRPCANALWQPTLSSEWKQADARFSRHDKMRWQKNQSINNWKVQLADLTFKLELTDFGHLGLFPEHSLLWHWMEKQITPKMRILNLFAYSGGATLISARAGAEVCHVDASQGMVQWARDNATLNKLSDRPIRWIVDDVLKFLIREKKRGSYYDGIILDPPSFGRGRQGEIFKIERDLKKLLNLCFEILTPDPRFLILSSHTPGHTPQVLHNLLAQRITKGKIEQGELLLSNEQTLPLPLGSYARWINA